MAAGRPTKYKESFCAELYDAMANGKSVTQFAAANGVSRSTVYKWAEEHPEFSDILSRGKEASEAYWETELQGMMYNPKINAPLVKLYFANRFDWHDRQAVDMTTGGETMKPVDRVTIEVVGSASAPSGD